MNSRTIILSFQASVTFLGLVALGALFSGNARAESAQVQNVAGSPVSSAAEVHSNAASTGGASSAIKIPAVPSLPGATAVSAVQTQTDSADSLTPAQRRTYQRASSAFTSFCHDWDRLLHEREVNNLEHLSWQQSGGLKMATYTGYGRVESCECHESKEGLPIGKIRYEEMLYSIAGKSADEARRATPKVMHEISTLEIFSWDKGKWFY
jgi:hypothetical protein